MPIRYEGFHLECVSRVFIPYSNNPLKPTPLSKYTDSVNCTHSMTSELNDHHCEVALTVTSSYVDTVIKCCHLKLFNLITAPPRSHMLQKNT